MNGLQRVICTVAIAAIVAINVPSALPRVYKGVQHAAGPSLVSVYVVNDDSKSVTVPVMNSRNHFETGQKVAVCLRNGYRDDEVQFAPRCTLALLFGFGTAYLLAGRLPKSRSAVTPNQGGQKIQVREVSISSEAVATACDRRR